MRKFFLTGSTGHVGQGVIEALMSKKKYKEHTILGSRHIHGGVEINNHVESRYFDFSKPESFEAALEGIQDVFLMRPPAITDVEGVFKPFILACEKQNVKRIIFLSLLGADKNPFPPHHKIEKIIRESKINYIFIRPSFFMQNLIQAHLYDIQNYQEIFIPAGNAKISFIDTRDIGAVIAQVLLDPTLKNMSITLTGIEAITLNEVARRMSDILGKEIKYKKPGLLSFRNRLIKRGEKKGYVNVMAILYLSTRLGMATQVNNEVEKYLKRSPRRIDDFIKDYRNLLLNH